MRLTVIGGCGAWPASGQACSGYLVDHDGFRLLIDPGYAVTPLIDPATVDAVFVSHGHPDHCADLNPLLRGRVLGAGGPLPVWSPPGAVDPVLALDGDWVRSAARPHAVEPGATFDLGPITATTRLLPHHVPNVGIRLTSDGVALAYTGDTGPSPEIVALADGVDLLLAEATYPERVPDDNAPYLSTARQAGRDASRAQVGHLVLTHLWPGTDAAASTDATRAAYDGPVDVARPGLEVSVRS
ncbi:MBL fold metallo-hydrolase [Virgisporangium ochraceum]